MESVKKIKFDLFFVLSLQREREGVLRRERK